MAKLIKSRLLAIHGKKIMVLQNIGPIVRYTLPGGIKKRSESIRETLLRETGEEIELQLTDSDVSFYFSYVRRSGKKRVHKHYFHTLLQPRKIEVLERHKFDSLHWLPWKKAIRFMDKSDRLAVKVYFKNVKKQLKNKGHDRTISSRIAL